MLRISSKKNLAAVKVMGVEIIPTLENASKFADDLAQLQASVFAQARGRDFLDLDGSAGHLNFELSKFGAALCAEIKADIRQNPSTALLKFYVDVLDSCIENHNYEIGSQIWKGICNAARRDHVDLPKDVYELPPLSSQEKQMLDKINRKLKTIKSWERLSNHMFPQTRKCKALYQSHIEKKEKFIPSVSGLFIFVDMWIQNAEGYYEAAKQSKDTLEVKRDDLENMKDSIKAGMELIEKIIREHLPELKPTLHFQFLAKKFMQQLGVKLVGRLSFVSPKAQDEALNKLLKIDRIDAAKTQQALHGLEKQVKTPRVNDVFIAVLRVNGTVYMSPRANSVAVTSPRMSMAAIVIEDSKSDSEASRQLAIESEATAVSGSSFDSSTTDDLEEELRVVTTPRV